MAPNAAASAARMRAASTEPAMRASVTLGSTEPQTEPLSGPSSMAGRARQRSFTTPGSTPALSIWVACARRSWIRLSTPAFSKTRQQARRTSDLTSCPASPSLGLGKRGRRGDWPRPALASVCVVLPRFTARTICSSSSEAASHARPFTGAGGLMIGGSQTNPDTGRRPHFWTPIEGERAESMFPAMSASTPCDWI